MAKNGNTKIRRLLRKETRKLQVPLTEPESRELARQAAELDGEIEALRSQEERLKASAKDARDKAEELEEDRRALSLKVRQGFEYREVLVHAELDMREGVVRAYRQDTGAEVGDPRPPTEEERQATLFANLHAGVPHNEEEEHEAKGDGAIDVTPPGKQKRLPPPKKPPEGREAQP